MKEKSIIRNLFAHARRPKAELPQGLQLSVVGYLIERQKHGAALRSDIEHEYSLKPATADALLLVMERDGLVTRAASDVAAGAETVSLTDRGYAYYRDALNRIWNLELDAGRGPAGGTFADPADGFGGTDGHCPECS